jgi:hypothetical protein
VQPNVVTLLPREESPAVVFDLVQPIRAARWFLDQSAELRLENGWDDFD